MPTSWDGVVHAEPTNHNVLGEEVVAEGAVVEVDLVERLLGKLHHVALIVAAIFVLADHLLATRQFLHGCFVALERDRQTSCISVHWDFFTFQFQR